MLVTESRPRTLKWFHAGPLLYGDWGTSRLYVLGLAFFYTGHASVMYLVAMGLIMAAVAWAYTVICRCFPDGGGTYTAARQLSPLLSVIGATLLLCDYIVTIAISAIEAFHYFGVGEQFALPLAVVTIFALGIVNWLGAKSAGRFALFIALVALGASTYVLIVAAPYIPEGISTISWGHPSVSGPWERWESLVRILLALAGIEAVANMTGLMRRPVARTSKRTIWPVLLEVAILNVIFGLALAGVPALAHMTDVPPDAVQLAHGGEPSQAVLEYRDTAMKLLATEGSQHLFGANLGGILGHICGGVFGLLLLSAANTGVMAMVSVMYSMAQDKELPRSMRRLNYSGVPSLPLVVAIIVSVVVLLIERDVAHLAELYAVGVVGAITISVLSCAINMKLTISQFTRLGLWALGVFMFLVEATIVVAKPNATIFAAVVIGSVLALRGLRRAITVGAPQPIPEPIQGWLGQVKTAEPFAIDPDKPKIMLAARGRYQSEFAVDLARRRKGTLFAIYVRTLRVMDLAPGRVPRIEEDPDAQEALGTTALLAKAAGVPFVPIYVTSADITGEILDYTVTYGCDTLIMGKSRRSMFARKIEGDVVTQVAEALPDDVALITRAATTPHVGTPIEIPPELSGQPGPSGQEGEDIGQSEDGEPAS
ncbi:MAG: universal stress protein [Phycisphaerales bacterium]